jgi:3-hydroxy acid dehydrogenase/malonic semialdehyde reductase
MRGRSDAPLAWLEANMYEGLKGKVAAVTGASAGIGEATARALAAAGCNLIIGARRMQKLSELQAEVAQKHPDIKVVAAPLDVRDPQMVEAFVGLTRDKFGQANILVNNAGLVRGLDPLASTTEDNWRVMIETNVVGLIRVTQGMMPLLLASGDAHIVNVASLAGWYAYPGGSVYCATKAAVRFLSQAMRVETVDKPVRLTVISPGMAETEFSEVRFFGDKEKAASVYKGVDPLVGADIADAIAWAVSRPKHVNVDEVLITPQQQGGILRTHRREG